MHTQPDIYTRMCAHTHWQNVRWWPCWRQCRSYIGNRHATTTLCFRRQQRSIGTRRQCTCDVLLMPRHSHVRACHQRATPTNISPYSLHITWCGEITSTVLLLTQKPKASALIPLLLHEYQTHGAHRRTYTRREKSKMIICAIFLFRWFSRLASVNWMFVSIFRQLHHFRCLPLCGDFFLLFLLQPLTWWQYLRRCNLKSICFDSDSISHNTAPFARIPHWPVNLSHWLAQMARSILTTEKSAKIRANSKSMKKIDKKCVVRMVKFFTNRRAACLLFTLFTAEWHRPNFVVCYSWNLEERTRNGCVFSFFMSACISSLRRCRAHKRNAETKNWVFLSK